MKRRHAWAVAAGVLVLCSCGTTAWHAPGEYDTARVRGEVSAMMDAIATDLGAEGSAAWLRHLHLEPSFFMATFGSMHLHGGAEARSYLADFAPKVAHVELHWSELRIEPLSDVLAAVAAAFDEQITMTAGDRQHFAGYFTGVATKTDAGWKLSHAHWSGPARGDG